MRKPVIDKKYAKYAVPFGLILLVGILLALGMPKVASTVAGLKSDPKVIALNRAGPYEGNKSGWGPDAAGQWSSPSMFKGSYLWVAYSAPWDHTAAMEAGVMRNAAQLPSKVRFVTLLTSGKQIGTAATLQDAIDWANNHGLKPDRVVASNISIRRPSPTHVLYDPNGKVVFTQEGWMTLDEVSEAVSRFSDN